MLIIFLNYLFLAGKRSKDDCSSGSSTPVPQTTIQQPIAGQPGHRGHQVRCTCGLDDDLERDLSPSYSPVHRPPGGQNKQNMSPLLQAEKYLHDNQSPSGYYGDSEPSGYHGNQSHHHVYSQSDTALLRPGLGQSQAMLQWQQYNDNNNSPSGGENVRESHVRPDGLSSPRPHQMPAAGVSSSHTHHKRSGPDRKDIESRVSNRLFSHESRPTFVPGFQTLGRNYNEPEYLIRWQAEQDRKSEIRRRRQLAAEGRLDEIDEVPVYLNPYPDRVPKHPVRSKSTQVTELSPDRGHSGQKGHKHKSSRVQRGHKGHAVQKKAGKGQRGVTNKAKASKTKKVMTTTI